MLYMPGVRLGVFFNMARKMQPGRPFLAFIGRTYSGVYPRLRSSSSMISAAVVTGSPLIATLRLLSAGSEYENQDIFSVFSSSLRNCCVVLYSVSDFGVKRTPFP